MSSVTCLCVQSSGGKSCREQRQPGQDGYAGQWRVCGPPEPSREEERERHPSRSEEHWKYLLVQRCHSSEQELEYDCSEVESRCSWVDAIPV